MLEVPAQVGRGRMMGDDSSGDGSDESNLANIPPKTNMAMEHPPCEDVCPIEHGDFPLP